LKDLDLLAPLDPPRGNVIAIGRNYQKHAEETALVEGREPNPPTIFSKAITSLTAPHGDITIDPRVSDKIDWEVELAIVIRKGRREHQARPCPPARLRLYRPQRRHGARHPEWLGRAVLQRQEPGSILPDRPVDRHPRRGRRPAVARPVPPRERHRQAGGQHTAT